MIFIIHIMYVWHLFNFLCQASYFFLNSFEIKLKILSKLVSAWKIKNQGFSKFLVQKSEKFGFWFLTNSTKLRFSPPFFLSKKVLEIIFLDIFQLFIQKILIKKEKRQFLRFIEKNWDKQKFQKFFPWFFFQKIFKIIFLLFFFPLNFYDLFSNYYYFIHSK